MLRALALAGDIGIEPTQWESEAQVLPLHQSPSHKRLYTNNKKNANIISNIVAFIDRMKISC